MNTSVFGLNVNKRMSRVEDGGAKVQVTGHRSDHRSQVGSQVAHKNNRILDKTVLDSHFIIQK